MKLTVLIPVYNTNPAHLMEAANGILNQDDGNEHDIILLDDGSTNDGTIKAMRWISCMGKNITIDRALSNQGTSDALNAGHQLAKTEYVAIIGSDDVYDSTKFRKQIEYLQNHPETDVLGTQCFSFYDHDITRKSNWTSKHLEKPAFNKTGFYVNHGTAIYRVKKAIEAGGYNLELRRGQDVDLWKRMYANGCVFRNLPEVLTGWRRFKKD